MIRPVNITDAGQILDIYNGYILTSTATFETEALTLQQMKDRIESLSACPYYVFEDDGRIAGYCYAHPWKERAAYAPTLETTVYVSPEYIHHGIGQTLMEHLIEECRRRGFHALIACITANNEGSIALHRRLGFEQVSHFREVGSKFGQLLDIVDLEYML